MRFIAYKATTGQAYVDSIINNGTGYQIDDIGGWDTGISAIAPFYFRVPIDAGETAAIGGTVYYRASDGEVRIHLF